METSKRVETKEEINILERQRNEPVVIEELKEELSVEQSIRKELIAKKDPREKSIVGESSIEEDQREQTNTEVNMKTGTISKENVQEKTDIEVKRSTSSESLIFDENSNCSEDSESDCEVTADKSRTTPLVKEMDEKSLQKFYAKTRKQRSDQALIDRVLQGRYFKMNQIFNDPSRAIPLPRRSGTINVTFSERAFPTPARESSHVEEQEVI